MSRYKLFCLTHGLLLDTWELYNFDNSHHFLTSNAAPGPVFIAMITVWMELWFTIYTQGRHSENIFGWKQVKLLLHTQHYKLLWLCFKIEKAFHIHSTSVQWHWTCIKNMFLLWRLWKRAWYMIFNYFLGIVSGLLHNRMTHNHVS